MQTKALLYSAEAKGTLSGLLKCEFNRVAASEMGREAVSILEPNCRVKIVFTDT